MPQERQSMIRSNFTQHLTSTVTKLRTDNKFTDVTLVCDDKRQFQAHKFILSASSSVFETMLSGANHQNPMILLHGIQSDVMDSLLQFMYFGETSCSEKTLDKFFIAARILDIQELQTGDQVVEQVFLEDRDSKSESYFESVLRLLTLSWL